ncbi:hypothetical protein [Pseudorhodoferax sp. Leaf274]|uniref:hypothetical protein n=1 Tax=Pseudorhodoferax sp. Leaf274 TaxID=1736318 RepID=UPI0007037F1B|nr:hypothetical protein [Pseudorhodoferax sp. Leaf274]KQP35459.1 hypothetical protein ASF44_19140 [Pseudorhodoferax sp. Leaf274]
MPWMPMMPWQVVAFLALLCATSAWVWAPQHWHAAVQASRAGRVLPLAFTALLVLVYGSMAV